LQNQIIDKKYGNWIYTLLFCSLILTFVTNFKNHWFTVNYISIKQGVPLLIFDSVPLKTPLGTREIKWTYGQK
jgi:hypothetical protein